MKVLIVLAHPEILSLTSSLAQIAKETFEAKGDQVEVSDLYAMNWKSNVDRNDFLTYKLERLFICNASKNATNEGRLTDDVIAEQKKLIWADALLFVFPLWWFSAPAILKGWVERVFSYGVGYGVGTHNNVHWGDRYGEGTFVGKKAMVITTAGGWQTHYSARGVNGPIEDLLFPINHGILFYAGYTVLPPFVVFRSDSLDPKGFNLVSKELKARITLFQENQPIKYRKQNRGDYTIPNLELLEDLNLEGSGFQQHIQENDEQYLGQNNQRQKTI